jgi:hypothetical protein
MRSDIQIPPPEGWPHRIRSAVIHVISLAHSSLTFARSVAANNINARIRLKAENRRLRQEIAILPVIGRHGNRACYAPDGGADETSNDRRGS